MSRWTKRGRLQAIGLRILKQSIDRVKHLIDAGPPADLTAEEACATLERAIVDLDEIRGQLVAAQAADADAQRAIDEQLAEIDQAQAAARAKLAATWARPARS